MRRLVAALVCALMAPALAGAADPAVMDLCDLGRMPVPPGAAGAASGASAAAAADAAAGTALPPPILAEALERALISTVAALDAGGVRQRAAAVLLRGSDAAGRPAAQSLSALAAATSDGAVAAWAMSRCYPDNNCAIAAIDRWATVEPDNAAPWLALWGRDPARAEQARAGVFRATRLQVHGGELAQTVLAAFPAAQPRYLLVDLAISAIGVDAALGWPPLHLLTTTLCSRAALTDAAVRAKCDSTARMLAEHSDTWVGVDLGLRVGEALGWPAPDIKRRRDELQALHSGNLDSEQPYSCAAVERLRRLVDDRVRLGELAAMKAYTASGRNAGTAAAPTAVGTLP